MPCVDTRSLGNTRSCICICAGCWASTCPGVSSIDKAVGPPPRITGRFGLAVGQRVVHLSMASAALMRVPPSINESHGIALVAKPVQIHRDKGHRVRLPGGCPVADPGITLRHRVTGLGPRDATQSAAAGGAATRVDPRTADAANRGIRKRCVCPARLSSFRETNPTHILCRSIPPHRPLSKSPPTGPSPIRQRRRTLTAAVGRRLDRRHRDGRRGSRRRRRRGGGLSHGHAPLDEGCARSDTTGCSRRLFLVKGHAQGTHRKDRAATHNCREHLDPSLSDLLIRLHG